jgi:hypothetical protein
MFFSEIAMSTGMPEGRASSGMLWALLEQSVAL